MPQMMPINWTLLYMMFITMYIFFMIFNYFNYMITMNKTPSSMNKTNPMGWKW